MEKSKNMYYVEKFDSKFIKINVFSYSKSENLISDYYPVYDTFGTAVDDPENISGKISQIKKTFSCDNRY